MTDGTEGLEPAELVFIIENLAALMSEKEVKQKFLEFSGKHLGPKQIQKISLRFSKQIREKNEAYLKNIKGCPLAHQRVRLDILWEVVKEAKKPRPVRSLKQTIDDHIIVEEPDNSSLLAAVKLAIDDLNKREQLDLQKNTSAEGSVEFDVDDGLTA